jgi:hypothetical protein
MKSEQALRQRVAQLKERGVNASLHEAQHTVVDLLLQVGDLSLYEIHQLVEVAVKDTSDRILSRINT